MAKQRKREKNTWKGTDKLADRDNSKIDRQAAVCVGRGSER